MSRSHAQPPATKRNGISRYFEVFPDFSSLTGTEEQLLEFPLNISQLASAAQTTVHTVRNYVLENLILCHEQTPGGYGLFDQCALNRLRLIRTARAAGLMILDIKPLIYAINACDPRACDDAMNALQIKINQRRTYLNIFDSMILEFR
ncbi:MerR family transcriptional regulator [Rheinheimera sp.]|uniref:MerR family transcriptional regulator n=1 Tax=Rheinheimera sp. TaxID=1869214 RepID=UPI0040476EEA